MIERAFFRVLRAELWAYILKSMLREGNWGNSLDPTSRHGELAAAF